MEAPRLAVLVSGSGTILEAILRADVSVDVVAADRSCQGLRIADDFGVTAVLVDRADYGGFGQEFDRVAYSEALVATLLERDVTLIAMAGFGTIVAPVFHDSFPGAVLNTHPSLLPAFKGWHAVADALAAGATRSGCTVHLATAELDEGPIIAQVAVDVAVDDTPESLQERIKVVERRLYPRVIERALAAQAAGDTVASIADLRYEV